MVEVRLINKKINENGKVEIFRKVNKNVTFREQIFINSISKYVKIYNNEMSSVIDQINEKTNILNLFGFKFRPLFM